MKRISTSRKRFLTAALVVLGLAWGLAVGRDLVAVKPAAPPVTEPAPPSAFHHPVLVQQPSEPPTVPTGLTNHRGEPAAVSCSACHATTRPDPSVRRGEDLVQFHQGLHYDHGALSCLSCHNADDYDTLRLADGTALAYQDSMRLCGQCHGPQLRDYERGLHGGMTGYWDLTRGPRTRQHCLACHDPHDPAFPLVHPVFPPRDRLPLPPTATVTPVPQTTP